MKFLLDTNVIRELGRSGRHKNVEIWLARVDDRDLAISALSVREIIKGVAMLRRAKPLVAQSLETSVATMFDSFEGRILPVDRRVATVWGEALALSDKHALDAGIAATAAVHGLTVVTRTTKDFAKRGIALLDPFKAQRRR